jgi:hypothetical protein
MIAKRLQVSPTPEALFRTSVSQPSGESIGIVHTSVRIDQLAAHGLTMFATELAALRIYADEVIE